MNILTETQIAWLAGLIEGEGCISFYAKTGVTLTVSMTDQDVINKIFSIVGAGKLYTQPYENKKTVYSWQLRPKQELEPILNAIRSHMGERRRAKIDEALIRLMLNPGKNFPIEHGTYKGYKKEEWQKIPFCQPCRDAYNAYRKEKKKKQNLV